MAARSSENPHELRERRRRLLTELRLRSSELEAPHLTSAAVTLLQDLVDRRLGELPLAETTLLEDLRERSLASARVRPEPSLTERDDPGRAPSIEGPRSGAGLGGRLPRSALVAALLVALGIVLTPMDHPAVLGYPASFVPLPTAEISDRVVLVTWDRTQAEGEPDPGQPDFADFADHRSYRSTHPTVFERLASAGASVVLLDAWIRGGDAEATEAVAEAVTLARAQGCEVVVPGRSEGGRWDPPAPTLAAAATAVGLAGSLVAEGPTGLGRQARLGSTSPPAGVPQWSLAVLALAALEGQEPSWTTADTIRVGSRTLETHGGLWLPRFSQTPAYRRYSYADVYYGRFDPEHIAGAVVLLGSTEGTQDRHRTPVGERYGIEVQADLINSLLANEFIQPVSRVARVVLALGIAALMALLVGAGRRGRPRRPSLWSVGLLCLFPLTALVLSRLGMAEGLWWPWTDVAVLSLLVFGWELRRKRAATPSDSSS